MLPLLVIGFCSLTVFRFLGAGRDDVYLTIWQGETLGQRPWFINYNYDYAEISSSLLHSLLIKLLSAVVPHSVVLANKLVGLAFAVATLVLIFMSRRIFFPTLAQQSGDTAAGADVEFFGAAVAAWLTATSPAFGYWALGGLETPLHAFFLLAYAGALASYLARPRRTGAWMTGLVSCLLILTRPEGIYVVALTALLISPLFRRGTAAADHVAAWIVPVACFVAVTALRYAFTGLFFPCPVYAKTRGLRWVVPRGVVYLLAYYSRGAIGAVHAAILIVAAAILIRAALRVLRRPRPSPGTHGGLLVLAALVVAADLFVVLTGGDWMEYFRILAPAVALKNVLTAAVLIAGLGQLKKWVPATRRVPMQPLTVMLLVLPIGILQMRDNGITPMFGLSNCSAPASRIIDGKSSESLASRVLNLNCTYARDAIAIGPFIRERLAAYVMQAGHVRIVSPQMGLFPYMVRQQFSVDQVDFIDPVGLTDPTIATLPVQVAGIFGNPEGDHRQLWQEIMRRNPNMIYLLQAPPAKRAALARVGFRVVWERPGAVVFWRAPPPPGR